MAIIQDWKEMRYKVIARHEENINTSLTEKPQFCVLTHMWHFKTGRTMGAVKKNPKASSGQGRGNTGIQCQNLKKWRKGFKC